MFFKATFIFIKDHYGGLQYDVSLTANILYMLKAAICIKFHPERLKLFWKSSEVSSVVKRQWF